MHAAELFSIGVETHGIVIPKNICNPILKVIVDNLQSAQNAVPTQYELRGTNLRADLAEGLFQVLHQVYAACHPQHQALFDGAKESHAVVRIHFLNRTDVVVAVNQHDYGRFCEALRVQLAQLNVQKSRVLLGSWQAIDLLYDPARAICLCDDQPLFCGDEMLALENLEGQRSGDQGQRSAVGPEAAVYKYGGLAKFKAVAR